MLPATTAPGVGHGKRYQDTCQAHISYLCENLSAHTLGEQATAFIFCPSGCQISSLFCLLRSNMWHNQVQGSTLHQTLSKKHPGPSSLAQELTAAVESQERVPSLPEQSANVHLIVAPRTVAFRGSYVQEGNLQRVLNIRAVSWLPPANRGYPVPKGYVLCSAADLSDSAG